MLSGIYSYLPTGWRSLQKLMAIVRRELDAAGAQELRLPGGATVRAVDRVRPLAALRQGTAADQGSPRPSVLLRSDTTEEVVTDIVRRDLKSYRQLPVNLYQIQARIPATRSRPAWLDASSSS